MKYPFLIIAGAIVLYGCTSPSPPSHQTPYDALTEALLTERLEIEVREEQGGAHPCEPQEPYYRLAVQKLEHEPYIKESTPERDVIDTREIWKDSDIANGIVMIQRTKEIQIMDTCLE